MLTLEHVTKVFKYDIFTKASKAVDDITCAFPAEECTGLLGHNGAGKTTSIRMIFGLIKPDKGSIKFNGRAIGTVQKKSIGYMPETNKLPQSLTCYEILDHHLKVYRPHMSNSERRIQIEDALNTVGLSESRHKRAGKLSKGMGRRIAWAQATIHNPDFVILDEPASGMDPVGRILMTQWINDLKRRKKGILLCTHDLQAVDDLCDNFHILNSGKLVYSTINPSPEMGQIIGFNRGKPMFKLKLSGMNDALIRTFSKELTAPLHIEAENLNSSLYFAQYNEASSWMSQCINAGLIVLEFKSTKHIESPKLFDFFNPVKSKT